MPPGPAARPLDAVDRRILEVLTGDARTTNRALAARVGLSAPACLRRVRRLEADGVIRRYTVDLGPAAAPAMVAYVGVRVVQHAHQTLTEFERGLATIPQVTHAAQVTGQFDYLLTVAVDDLAAYRHFHTHQLAALPGVAHVTTFVVVQDLDVHAG